jgi:hypothetical protein
MSDMKYLKVPNILPGNVYTLTTLRELLELKTGSLPREIKLGKLKAHRVCGRYLILGEDVLEWIRAAGRHGDQQKTNGFARART